MKTILFSPVGGTDPISENNCRDGSLLHICRVYKPDKVILYMSKEMLEKHIQDNRYIYCLDKLAELQDRKMEYDIVKRPDLEKVYDFDFFYKDFKLVIDKIIEELHEEDELLINISSGTPAMKSSLTVLQTLIEFSSKLIQVTTPAEGMNEHTHTDISIEKLWKLNEDNKAEFENRCLETTCPTLSEIKKEEMIKRHLQAYDYGAALDVAKTLSKKRTNRYYNLLKMAYDRYLLDVNSIKPYCDDSPEGVFPVRSENGMKLFEYALQIKAKMQRKEYADFIRAITPLLADLFEEILRKTCNIDINAYTRKNLKKDSTTKIIQEVREWDKNKLHSTELLKVLEKEYNGFKCGMISSEHLMHLILKFSKQSQLSTIVRMLRSVEYNVRNMAAHEIVSIDDDLIYKRTGYRSDRIMVMIQQLFYFIGIRIKPREWNAYDNMNEYIISKM